MISYSHDTEISESFETEGCKYTPCVCPTKDVPNLDRYIQIFLDKNGRHLLWEGGGMLSGPFP
jgi:hypothetical protein